MVATGDEGTPRDLERPCLFAPWFIDVRLAREVNSGLLLAGGDDGREGSSGAGDRELCPLAEPDC